ncbi:hypothetical protein FUAX_30070 [Fulvitalea axinellae]|uniref:FAS1 domain-containing protein n=1 Tax=Fulvitalea axinellae TaxID=1182444 RepID=A0AAU9DDN6_9BACT|nr:hypothetical protein FUAX_30070 [Fulvitalea axinellae]
MKNIILNRLAKLGALLLVLAFGACDEVDKDAVFTDDNLQTAIQFMENDPEGRFEEWLKVIEASDYYGMVNARGSYTFLICENEGVQSFLGNRSLESMEKAEVNLLVKSNIVMTDYFSYTLNQGPMGDTTMNGNYLTVMFGAGGFSNMLVNQKSKIVNRDIECSNGVVHILDKPVEPIGQGVHGTLVDIGEFGIFAEAVEKAGLVDTLDLMTTPEGKKVRYTVYAETDQAFAKKGVKDFAGLVEFLGAGTDYTSRTNELHRFVRHHIISGKKYSNRLASDIILTAGGTMVRLDKSQELSQVFVNPEYDIFEEVIPEESNRLDLGRLDYQSKNAVIHALEDVLTIKELAPATVYDDMGAVPELDEYRWDAKYKEYRFWVKDVERWRGEGYDKFAYRYYTHIGGLHESDNFICYSSSSGWFEFETKPILKGKYEVSLRVGDTRSEGSYKVYMDDVLCKNVMPPRAGSFVLGEYEFDKNEPHVIRLESFTGGRLALDVFVFKPVN